MLVYFFTHIQLWSCSKQETLQIWQIVDEDDKISLLKLKTVTVPVLLKGIFPLIGGSVCTSTSDGKLLLWDTKVIIFIIFVFAFYAKRNSI